MLNDLLYRLRAIFRRNAVEGELQDELQFHFEHQVQAYIESGLPRLEAERRARMTLGGLELLKEECRQARGVSTVQTLLQDLRYGFRALRRSPGFVVTAALTLAIGIGANTAIFSVVNAELLRPLPYPDPQKIVLLWGTNSQSRKAPFSEPDFLDYQDRNRVFEQIAAFTGTAMTLTGDVSPERLRGGRVTAGFFDVLAVKPALGRTFLPEEGEPGRTAVVVLGHGLWQRRFGLDPGIVGRTILLNMRPYNVIGVLPAAFDFSLPGYFGAKDLWIPAALRRDEAERGHHYLRVIARLKRAVDVRQAQVDLDGIGRGLAREYPQLAGTAAALVPLQEQIAGNVRTTLWMLLGTVSFVLLIACANVANLQLARSSARHKELAIRAALGAGRGRVVQQLMTESLMVALLGGILGLALAWWCLQAIVVVAPANLPRHYTHSLDWRVLAYVVGVSLLTGILFGLAPALQSCSAAPIDSLKQGGRASGDSSGGGRSRRVLLVAELALSLVLLAGAGLLIRSFLRLVNVRPGFDAAHVLVVSIDLPGYAYRDETEQAALYRDALERIRALAGVQAAGAIDDLPLTPDSDSSGFSVEGRPPLPTDQLPETQMRSVTPGYFRAMGIPLIAGRGFSEADTSRTSSVMLINQTLARRIFAGENPIGKRATFGAPSAQSTWMTIVGVVGDVRDAALDLQAGMEVYQPSAQYTLPYMNLVVRTAGSPAAYAPPVRAAIHALDKDLALNARPMEEILAASISERRFNMLLLSVFAALALLLAGVGIYGVVSYSAVQRTGEIGLRVALGASRGDVLKLVLGQSLALTAVGVGTGLAAALGLTALLSKMLYGVRATDPWTFGASALLLALVSLLASYIPARRAMNVDPLVALRSE